MTNCKCCKGEGIIRILNRHKSKGDVDMWNCKCFEGQKYHIRVCLKCYGTGERLNLTELGLDDLILGDIYEKIQSI